MEYVIKHSFQQFQQERQMPQVWLVPCQHGLLVQECWFGNVGSGRLV